tara:strand:- start:162 stop:866 length:705 start_codon:yes stop_codon:yes gene_type:complete
LKIPILLNGSLVVDDEFLSQNPPNIPDINDLEIGYSGEGEKPDFVAVKDKLYALREGYENKKPEIDGESAKIIHELLPLKRNEACDSRFWHYLTVYEYPEYVAWRWFDSKKEKINKERYLGRWDGNALGRLWWWAEFTRDPTNNNDNYHRTLMGAKSQEFMLHSVDNLLGGNKYLLNSLCDIVFQREKKLTNSSIRKLFVRVNAALVTISVDSLSEKDIAALIERIHASLSEKK